jgi:hypothetical protein
MTASPLTQDCPHTNRLSQALDRQRPPARQTANFVCPHSASVAGQRTAGPPIAVPAGRTIAAITSIQTH